MFNVSTEYLTAIKQATRTVKSSIGYGDRSFTNLMANSDFINDSVGWSTSNCTISSTGGIGTVTATGQYGGVYQSFTPATYAGHKMYARTRVKCDSSYISLLMYDGASYTTANYSGSNTYETLSFIKTMSTSSTSCIAKVQDGRASAWTPHYIDNFMLLDLTAIYGAGNEPSKAYMDDMIDMVGHFDGTTDLPIRFMDDRLIGNALLNGNFVNTSNWTGGTSANLTATGNVGTATGTGTNPYTYFQQSLTGITTGSKLYAMCKARVTNSLCTKLMMYTNPDGVANTFNTVNTPVSGTWYTMSGLITSTNAPTSIMCTAYYATGADATNAVQEVKEFTLINLTALYGEGKEPPIEYMNALMSTYGWFQSKTLNLTESGERTCITDFTVDTSFGSDGLPTIGSTVAGKLNVKFVTDSRLPQSLNNVAIRPYTAIDINGLGKYEWVRHGEFYADYSDIVRNKMTTTLEGYDHMAYYDSKEYDTTITFPAKLETIITDLEANYDIDFSPRALYGRNICVTQFQDWETGYYDSTGVKQPYASRIRLGGGYVAVIPTETYYFNTFETDGTKDPKFVIRSYNQAGTFVRNIGVVQNGATVTMQSNEFFISVSMYEPTDTVDFTWWQQAFADQRVKPFICLNSEVNKTFDIFLPHIRFNTKPSGTVRQILGMIASYLSTNATVNDLGKIEFRFLEASGFSMDYTNYSDFKLTSDSSVGITQLILKQSDGTDVYAGTAGGYALQFENPEVMDEDLTVMYARRFPLNYHPFTMKSQGMPHLQIGDTISFSYINDLGKVVILSLPMIIISHKLTFNGGLSSEFNASSPKKEKTDVTVTGGSTVEKSVKQTYNQLIDAMSSAMQIITGNTGGNVITILDEQGLPKELVISDKPDLNDNTANVWRWNSGGLAFSDQGYNPTDPSAYRVAITRDGQISADFVTTGTLTADLIKAGIMQSFNGASWINMTDGTFSFGNDKLVWDGNNFTINYNGTDLDSALNLKADKSQLTGMETYFKFGEDKLTIGKTTSPQQITVDNTSVQFIDTANGTEIQLTALTGNGTTITGTFATQSKAPYTVGSYIEIKDNVPTAYNGTWKVTACTTTTVTATCTTTGTVTTLGKVKWGFHADPNAVAWINGQKMYIKDLQLTQNLTIGVHQIQNYSNTLTLIKYVG